MSACPWSRNLVRRVTCVTPSVMRLNASRSCLSIPRSTSSIVSSSLVLGVCPSLALNCATIRLPVAIRFFWMSYMPRTVERSRVLSILGTPGKGREATEIWLS